MTSPPQAPAATDVDALLAAMRPRLHRYCARMVGSVIDGEDVLQDALIKAMEAFAPAGPDPAPGSLAVPDRAQHRARFPQAAQPPGSAPRAGGGGHDGRRA
ncbi:putative RNA polymerase sigma factor [Bradyrhizobium sp. JR6.1]